MISHVRELVSLSEVQIEIELASLLDFSARRNRA